MLKNSPIALHMKPLFPNMLQVTFVCSPSFSKVNSTVLLALNGLKNSRFIRTNSSGQLAMMVMRPWPILLFPTQASAAPVPLGAPL